MSAKTTSWARSADFYCGMLLLAIAASGIWLVSDLDVGGAREMGPAYFPLLVSGALAILSLIMIVRSFVHAEPEVGRFEFRPLLAILFAFLVFAALIDKAGLLISIFAQLAVAHFATPQTRWLETLLFAVGLAIFSMVVFVVLLKMPVALFP